MELNNKRIISLDILKAFAIFLVCWGHAIQYLHHDETFWNNKIWEMIYSFHMPLFFFISGYFVRKSIVTLKFTVFLRKRSFELIIPYLSWHILHLLYYKICYGSLTFGGKSWLWFLPVLFVCQLILFLLNKLYFKNKICCIIFFLVLFLIPSFGRFVFYLLFLLLGFIVSFYYHSNEKGFRVIALISILIFLFLCPYYKGEYYVYFSNFIQYRDGVVINITSNDFITIYKFFIGLSASIFFFVFVQCINFNGNNILSNIGVNTLGIYILQSILLEQLLPDFIDLSCFDLEKTASAFCYSSLIAPIIAFVNVLICLMLCSIIAKSKYLGFLFLGKRIK
jgi:fucose 4-O-acetylase-like acetyltransferase